jgi:hypothetical protein
MKRERRIAYFALGIVLLALIRSLGEPLRQSYFSSSPIPFSAVKMYLVGGMAAGAGALIVSIASFYERYRLMTVFSLATIAALFIIKFLYAS